MTNSKITIEEVRLAIDQSDDILMKALGARFRAVKYLGGLKKSEKKPIEDLAREKQLKTRWKQKARELELNQEFVLLILDIVLAESKRVQSEIED